MRKKKTNLELFEIICNYLQVTMIAMYRAASKKKSGLSVLYNKGMKALIDNLQ